MVESIKTLLWVLEVLDFIRHQSVSLQCPHLYLVILVLVFSYIHNMLSERKVDNGEMNPLQFSSVLQSCLTFCDPMDFRMPGLPVHHQLPELTQTQAIQPSYHLSPPSPPAFDLSQRQVFSSESILCIRWPKYWSFSFSISPSSQYLGLISFRIGWFDLLAVQGSH